MRCFSGKRGGPQCSAPLQSSHGLELLSAVLRGAEIAQGLVRPSCIVPLDPPCDDVPRLVETLEAMLPDALLLEASEEPFDKAILFGGVRGDVLLFESIETAGCCETAALEDQAVVTADDRSLLCEAEGAEASDAGLFQGSFGFLGPATKSELPSHDLAIVTVDDGHQMAPAILAAVHVGDVHGPALVTAGCDAFSPVDPGAWSGDPLVHQPPFELHEAVYLFRLYPKLSTDGVGSGPVDIG